MLLAVAISIHRLHIEQVQRPILSTVKNDIIRYVAFYAPNAFGLLRLVHASAWKLVDRKLNRKLSDKVRNFEHFIFVRADVGHLVDVGQRNDTVAKET